MIDWNKPIETTEGRPAVVLEETKVIVNSRYTSAWVAFKFNEDDWLTDLFDERGNVPYTCGPQHHTKIRNKTEKHQAYLVLDREGRVCGAHNRRDANLVLKSAVDPGNQYQLVEVEYELPERDNE